MEMFLLSSLSVSGGHSGSSNDKVLGPTPSSSQQVEPGVTVRVSISCANQLVGGLTHDNHTLAARAVCPPADLHPMYPMGWQFFIQWHIY